MNDAILRAFALARADLDVQLAQRDVVKPCRIEIEAEQIDADKWRAFAWIFPT